ncbi:MAG: hypothetical protein CV087_05685 [Candidatus Brocadia sp. WS118]|nr:MAG: hypothetical protein CV087_05685 [Candidatus Brocadia sp. WS118]
MNYTIICLANSRKHQGRCVAGKTEDGKKWIRPVSEGDDEGLSQDHITYSDGNQVRVLDIIQIKLESTKPSVCHPENYLNSETTAWKKVGLYDVKKLDNICDHPSNLWLVDERQDRVPQAYWKNSTIKSSLYLIKPSSFHLVREDYTYPNGNIKKKVRGVFAYNNTDYDFRVTDIEVEDKYLKKNVGKHSLKCGHVYLCISLSEPFTGQDNACFKLVASVIQV